MARTVVRGTPYTHIASPSANQGFSPSTPGKTVQPQFQGGGINTQANTQGTPYNSGRGNPDETRRVVSSDKYGKVMSNSQGDANDPKNNGDGTVLDNMTVDYASASPQPTLDSPVPGGAPAFDVGEIIPVNKARLGSGMPDAAARDDLLNLGGVMSRGMLGTSKPGQPETALTDDDTLPAVGAAR